MISSNKKINDIIKKRIDDAVPIPDMVLDDFLELVARACEEAHALHEDAPLTSGGMTGKISGAAFGDLTKRLQDIYAYKLFDEMTSDTAFRIGACWGGVEIVEKCEKRQQDSALEEEELCFVRKHAKLFKTIASRPGLRHCEIAKEIQVSDPRLTQLVKEAKPYQLISTSVRGRSKHYYLTQKGSSRLQTCFEERAATSSAGMSWREGSAANSNIGHNSSLDYLSKKAANDAGAMFATRQIERGIASVQNSYVGLEWLSNYMRSAQHV